MQHGTGTWINNVESLLSTGAVTTEQVIACREDVLEYLLAHGVEREQAYEMMEDVRKGRADALWNPSNSSPKAKRQQQILQDCGAEVWFIESCRKIKYLFPRAHAAAFSASLIRVYLKTHDVTGSEGFLRCARHFFAGILTYFKEK